MIARLRWIALWTLTEREELEAALKEPPPDGGCGTPGRSASGSSAGSEGN